MSNYDNTNRGALFKVAEKRERGPDYDGTLNVNGTDYWISAWIKESKAGAKFMSLSVKPKERAPAPEPSAAPAADDDIPF